DDGAVGGPGRWRRRSPGRLLGDWNTDEANGQHCCCRPAEQLKSSAVGHAVSPERIFLSVISDQPLNYTPADRMHAIGESTTRPRIDDEHRVRSARGRRTFAAGQGIYFGATRSGP